MGERPIAWLWQNAEILEDGCFNFYPSEERAREEIGGHTGWAAPVFVSVTGSTAPARINQVFNALDQHRPGEPVVLSPSHAAAVLIYLAEEARLYPAPPHPSRSTQNGEA